MIKKIVDTNIFIDRFSVPQLHKEIFVTKGFVYLSSIVMMELMAGAHTKDTCNTIGELVAFHKRTGRIVVPTSTAYEQAGDMLAKLQRTKGYNLKKCASIANDCLIAASARSIGAIVYTQNRKDFQAIKEVFDFQVTYISAKADGIQTDDTT